MADNQGALQEQALALCLEALLVGLMFNRYAEPAGFVSRQLSGEAVRQRLHEAKRWCVRFCAHVAASTKRCFATGGDQHSRQ